jgi:mannose-6-phosphate isomerase-like protein (cupin superfamily)
MNRPVSPLEVAESLTEFWSPRVIAELDNSYVKVAKLKGTLAWHNHEDEDELFLVLKGSLRIEFENGHVDLEEGDLHVVPKGAQHNPIAADECLVMLIERRSTLHTGDTRTSKTRDISEQLADFNPGGQQSSESQK